MENYNNENDLAQQENDLSQTGSSIEQITEQNSVTEQIMILKIQVLREPPFL